jgi:CDI immunity proteins
MKVKTTIEAIAAVIRRQRQSRQLLLWLQAGLFVLLFFAKMSFWRVWGILVVWTAGSIAYRGLSGGNVLIPEEISRILSRLTSGMTAQEVKTIITAGYPATTMTNNPMDERGSYLDFRLNGRYTLSFAAERSQEKEQIVLAGKVLTFLRDSQRGRRVVIQQLEWDGSIADIMGPWVDPEFESGLIARCKNAWNKPLRELTNEELATMLRQKIATEHILPIAKARITEGIDDDTEMFDGELQEAIERAERYH